MAVAPSEICNPAVYPLEEAVQIARECAVTAPGFEIQIAQFLQTMCLSPRAPRPVVLRGLEVLSAMFVGETAHITRLVTLLRPFLKASDPQIASKAVLILGQRSKNISWLRKLMSETDQRLRVNLIESLWQRTEPEVEAVFQSALRDSRPRVAANAVYGLYLMGSMKWPEALEELLCNGDPAFRCSAIWVSRAIARPDFCTRLQPLIRDPNARVRRAAFEALKSIRNKSLLRVA